MSKNIAELPNITAGVSPMDSLSSLNGMGLFMNPKGASTPEIVGNETGI